MSSHHIYKWLEKQIPNFVWKQASVFLIWRIKQDWFTYGDVTPRVMPSKFSAAFCLRWNVHMILLTALSDIIIEYRWGANFEISDIVAWLFFPLGKVLNIYLMLIVLDI